MELRRFETPGIAHYAYLLADGGEAAVIDPRRDVDEYIRVARTLGVRIRYVIETHRQEDFVMGAAHLAERTGAAIVNGAHELFGHGDIRLADGDAIDLGRARIRALHTPGHTPESMSYAVFPREELWQAWGVFTGDALFFGDTGRTDLSDPDRTEENAALLYEMIHRKIVPLGDGALVFPAHGPGSVCGSGMDPRPMSTIGGERQYNAVLTSSQDVFVRRKASERLPRPPYFRTMEKVNLQGGLAPVGSPGEVPLLTPDEVAQAAKHAELLDTREPEAFAGGHIAGAYSIWLDGLAPFAGWIAEPTTPIVLILERDTDLEAAYLHLSRIGLDGVEGALLGGFDAWRTSGHPIETSGIITPHELTARADMLEVLDVREPAAYDAGHIAGARHCWVGDVEREVGALELDHRQPVVVTCGSGHRSGLAASMLLRHEFHDVRNLLGGMTAWRELDLPWERKAA